MNLEKDLQERSSSNCELCGSKDNLSVYEVPPITKPTKETTAYLCSTCTSQIEKNEDITPNHWRCLNDSMWNETPVIQILAWRMLNRLNNEDWAQGLLDMLYLDEDNLVWAQATGEHKSDEDTIKHIDSNGVQLQIGDTVTVIKDLNVKGAGFIVKRGTPVRNINLVEDNPEHIEGKVSGQHIVILTKYVKK